MSKYLRIPFDENECERIDEELSLAEKKEAIVQAYNEKVDSESDNSDELSAYDSVPEIMEDESLSQVEKRQLKIKAERRSDIKKR